MSTGIYYFSGTGNSFASAKQIANNIGNSCVIAITDKLLTDNAPIKHDRVVIIYPAYAYGIPAILYRFFTDMRFETEHLSLLVTYGTKYGAALIHAKRLLNKNNVQVNYFDGIKCVENYIPIFGLAKDEVLNARIEQQHLMTAEIIQNILAKKQNGTRGFKPFSRFISWLFRFAKPLFAATYKFTDRCTSCGICRDICPAGAITMEEGQKPKVKARKCEHCQGCLNWCPFKAINYVRMHKSSRRYHHPDVSLNEMKQHAPATPAKHLNPPHGEFDTTCTAEPLLSTAEKTEEHETPVV